MFFDSDFFNNPIVAREMSLAFRRRGALTRLLLFSAATAAAVYIVWPREPKLANYRFIISERTLEIMASALRVMVLLMGPAYAALSVTREREQGALDMLCLSPGGGRQIFHGKILASTAFVWMLIAATLPVAATVYLLGGVALWEISIIYLELFLWGAAICAYGVLCSAQSERSPGALAMAYCHIIPVGALWVAFPKVHPLWILAPIIAIPMIVRHQPTIRGLLYPSNLAHREPENDKDRAMSARDERFWAILLLIPPRLRRPMMDWMSPVLIRELRYERLGGALWLRRLLPPIYVAALLGGVWLVGFKDLAPIWFLMACGVAFLIVPTLGAPAMTREFDMKTFDSMVVTLLRPPSILLAKIYVAARSGGAAILGLAAVAAVIAAHKTSSSGGEMATCLLILGVTIVFLAVIGVFCSMAAGSTAQALVMTYCVAGILFAAGPLVCHLLRMFSDVPVESYAWIALCSPAAPLLAFAETKILSDVSAFYGADGLAVMYCVLALSLSVFLVVAMSVGFDFFWKKGLLRRT